MSTTDATARTEAAVPERWLSSRRAHASALSCWLLSLVLFWPALTSLANLSFHDELASHILLIPLISGFVIYLGRRRIFRTCQYCPSIGLPVLLVAAVLWYGLSTPISHLNNTNHLSVAASLIVLTWIGAFILCYGTKACRAAAFPLLFLFLMIPLPVVVLQDLASILQRGSAATCYWLFRLAGVPVIRHGFRFSLPGVDIEVAEQCSGIHAGLSLFIAGLLAQYILLQGAWKKAFFTMCILPIAMFKNAVRIVTIAWLGMHVNRDFFHGQLHRQGGLPFSVLAMALLGMLLWLLRRPSSLLGRKDAAGPLISEGAVIAKS